MISFVYAQERDGGIGYQNELPWHLPNDLKFFKAMTMGHTMLMGRKTFEAMDQRLLPGRKTVVLTNQADYGQDIEGLEVVHTVEEVLALSKGQTLKVIGGAKIFKQLFPYADEIIRTVIDESFPADVYMPAIDEDQWTLIKTEAGITDEKNHYAYQFEWWQRKMKGN